MRWIEPEAKYTAGARRVVRRFLWLPTKPMFSREWRWLEFAHVEQQWLEGVIVKFWADIRWKDEN